MVRIKIQKLAATQAQEDLVEKFYRFLLDPLSQSFPDDSTY
jgi:hypothetical protein